MTERNDHQLDAFFAAGRAAAPEPSDALMARILADADALQPAPPRPARPAPPARGWRAALGMLGGWQAVSGLATAAAAGLWIGISPPAAVAGIAGEFWSQPQPLELELTDQYQVFDDLLGEG